MVHSIVKYNIYPSKIKIYKPCKIAALIHMDEVFLRGVNDRLRETLEESISSVRDLVH